MAEGGAAEAGVYGNLAFESWYIVLQKIKFPVEWQRFSINKMAYHANWRGCSGALIGTPGVFGSSIISGSGGLEDPSMLRVRVFANRAVIASRLGIFL